MFSFTTIEVAQTLYDIRPLHAKNMELLSKFAILTSIKGHGSIEK